VCTLALFRSSSTRFPLVVAANRDELLARPTSPPARLGDVAGVVAGRDLEAGGTWLGARVAGAPLVAGLLNRRTAETKPGSSSGELSRGSLCLDALRARSVDEALRAIEAAGDLARYGPFNLLLADRARAVVLDNARGLRATELGTGMSLLTNLDVNDPRCPRLASAVRPFEQVARRLETGADAHEIVAECARVLASHENSLDPADASPLSRLCVHTEIYGTRSSSVILVDADNRVRYFHAAGPPCTAPFVEVASSEAGPKV
jgi:uncharacterized protein with NRDE domain